MDKQLTYTGQEWDDNGNIVYHEFTDENGEKYYLKYTIIGVFDKSNEPYENEFEEE